MIHPPGVQQQAAQSGQQHLPASRQRIARIRPTLNLVSEADNEAAVHWREHQPFRDRVRLPADLVLQDNSFERHAYENGAFIGHLSEDLSGDTVELGIWGGQEQVAAAKKAIVKWSHGSHRGDRQQNFHKLASLLPSERRQKEKEYRLKVRQHRFRQFPPVDMGFEAIGSFHWPVDEYRPDEVFGKSCEALDAIRMDCYCYINFVPARSMFQVCGKTADVQEALDRLRMTYFQIVARMATVDFARKYVLYWPISSDLPSYVKLEPYHPSAVISPTRTRNTLEPDLCPRAYLVSHDLITTDKPTELNNATLCIADVQKSIMQTLRKIHYYRGHIEFRLHLGRFVLNRYERPNNGIYTIEKFKSMIQDTQFVGNVTDEIGDRDVESQMLTTLETFGDLLKPADSLIKELRAISPRFSAIFIFSNPSGDLCLEVTWQEVENGLGMTQYELGEVKWARLDRDSGAISKLHEVALIDLHTSSAWEFQVVSSDVVDSSKIPILLRDFTSKIRLRCTVNQVLQNHPTLELPHFPKPKFYREQKTYEYGIRDSKYLLNLTHFQDHTLVQSQVSPQQTATTTLEARWALSVSLSEWKIKLSENARLPIGGQAAWDDKESNWFPRTGDDDVSGFARLVRYLEALTRRIHGNATETSDEEDSAEMFQGMTIG